MTFLSSGKCRWSRTLTRRTNTPNLGADFKIRCRRVDKIGADLARPASLSTAFGSVAAPYARG
jgi:hypothetical protein